MKKNMNTNTESLKIAVVGGGISGIMAAYLLQKKHDITIFESDNCLGGHAHSVKINNGKDEPFEVDTAFLVFNNISYPLFIKFIRELNVYNHVERAEMSFSFSDYQKNLHFSVGANPSTIFYQKRNVFNPKFYKMFGDLIRFRRNAYSDLINKKLANITLEEYVSDYSDLFKENMIAPTAVSVWSLPKEDIWKLPAETYINFQNNHNYLKGFGWITSGWFTFKGSSSVYVKAFIENFEGNINLNSKIRKVKRYIDKVEIVKNDGTIEEFDKVIMATHADITLKLLDEPSEMENELLQKWVYHSSEITLHTDKSIMFPDKKLWASWNVKIKENNEVTYYLNRVQNLNTETDYFLTFSDNVKIDSDKIIEKFNYSHPVLDFNSVKTQKRLDSLNGYLNSYFCGSYFGYGFHEDAIKSAIKVAHKFGIDF